jgi:hypothetical protein
VFFFGIRFYNLPVRARCVTPTVANQLVCNSERYIQITFSSFYLFLLVMNKRNKDSSLSPPNHQVLSLATATIDSSHMNVFITNRMFGPAINKAKRMALLDLQKCIATTGILQTRSFIQPECYSEMIDCIFRLVYLCLYRQYFENEGLNQTLSHGKLVSIVNRCSFPSRIVELAFIVLSPVVLKTEMFIPSPELVRCVQFENLKDSTYVFSVTIGRVDPLAARYGIPLRVGIINILKNLPGSMRDLTPLTPSEVHPVLRNVKFISWSESDYESFKPTLVDVNLEGPAHKDTRIIPEDIASMSTPNFTARIESLRSDLYPTNDGDIDQVIDYKWFVPHVYTKLKDEYTFSKVLGAYLPLVIYTADDLERPGIRAVTLLSDFGYDGTYEPSFCNSVRSDFSAAILHSLKSLRIKEGRMTPSFLDQFEMEGIINRTITSTWKETEFPSLDSAETFHQPFWACLPEDSPVYPYRIHWTRRAKLDAAPVRMPKAKAIVQENVHEMKDVSDNKSKKAKT